MISADGRYALVFNGEVYNFREIRARLEKEGFQFRSSSDSEVVLYALAKWGKKALELFNGMFALALYDAREKRLLLARDHAGIKPLYYHLSARGLLFASQYDQIIQHPWTRDSKISPDAIGLYLRFGYVPAPFAMLSDSGMLEAGAWLEVSADGKVARGYHYQFPQYLEPKTSLKDTDEELDDILKRVIKRHMISDVPVGIFLSGGVDSPLVGAEVALNAGRNVKAFTIGVDHSEMDEATDAARFAAEFGLDHRVEYISQNQAMDCFDEVLSACSEPTSDYSIFPTFLVSKLAAQAVKVVLSGDGGDEPFFGYPSRMGSPIKLARYFSKNYAAKIAHILLRKSFGAGCATKDVLFDTVGQLCLKKESIIPSDLTAKFFPVQFGTAGLEMFDFSSSDPDRVAQYVRWLEYQVHLSRVLLKVDRASMHHSLEVRVPLLDKEVLDYATRLHWSECINLEDSIGKIPLRNLLKRHTQFQAMKKRGFTVPIGQWLQGHFKEIFHGAVIDKNEILGSPTNRQNIANAYQDLLNGKQEMAWPLWSLLMLSMWEEKHLKSRRYMPEMLN